MEIPNLGVCSLFLVITTCYCVGVFEMKFEMWEPSLTPSTIPPIITSNVHQQQIGHSYIIAYCPSPTYTKMQANEPYYYRGNVGESMPDNAPKVIVDASVEVLPEFCCRDLRLSS